MIVLLEDDAAVRASLQLLLELEGYVVKAFESVATFMKHLFDADALPHCVIADVQLPDGDGREVAAHLAKHNPSVPVILMSGANTGAMHDDAVTAGAIAYFDKPIDCDQLLAAVAQAMPS